MSGTIGMEQGGAMIKVGIVMPILTQHKRALEAVSTVYTEHNWEYYPICNWFNNFSVAQSWNHGMRMAINRGCSHVLILNDDILLSKVAIDTLVEAMIKDDEIGVVTCRDYRKRFSSNPYAIIDFTPEESYLADGPDFAAFMITPEKYEEIGEFDENFFPAYFEDNDYVYRTILKKYKCVSHMGAPFYHFGSQTQNNGGTPIVDGMRFEANRDYFMSKWGGQPGQERFVEPFNGQR